MTKPLTYDEVVTLIKELNCTPSFNEDWFLNNYKSVRTNLPLICSCGEPFEKYIGSLKKSNHCKKCSSLLKKEQMIITFEKVEEFVKTNTNCKIGFTKEWFDNNYEGNSKTKLNFMCICGNPFKTTFNQFKKVTQRCKDCSNESRRKFHNISYERIISELAITTCKAGFTKEWFEKFYKNDSTKIPFICDCGNDFSTSYKCFKKGVIHCKECSNENRRKSKTFSYEKIIKIIVEGNCTPNFDEKWYVQFYKNSKTKLPLICKCGEPFTPTLADFQKTTKQCNDCAKEIVRNAIVTKFEDVKKFVDTTTCKIGFTEEEFYQIFKRTISSKLPFICKCGVKFECVFVKFVGGQQSCKTCSKSESKYERTGYELCDFYNIKYKPQFIFKDCKDKSYLPFDMALFSSNKDKRPICLVEFDGLQHFEPVKFGGISDEKALFNFKETIRRDEIKNKYCLSKKIPLIRIDCQKEFSQKKKEEIEKILIQLFYQFNLISKEANIA